MGRTARVLVIDDETSMLDELKLSLAESGYDVEAASNGVEGIARTRQSGFDVVVTALRTQNLEVVERVKEISAAIEVIVISDRETVPSTMEVIEAGAFYLVQKPLETARLQLLIERALEKRALAAETLALRTVLGGENRTIARSNGATAFPARSAPQSTRGKHCVDIIGRSKAMQEIYSLIASVAASDANILIVGESGTGKELIANAIHASSLRARERFVKIDCATLPHELIEAELFGHAKGAFTGASSARQGLIAKAGGGSLLLDEIGEMPMGLQPKLLRVLQEREYRPLGSDKPVAVDFRLIASTNRQPREAVRDGLLREDLYYRMSTITIVVPPLRDRLTDIDLLAESMLERFAGKYGKSIAGFSPAALEAMYDYGWPGNVRELENVIERAVLLTSGSTVEAGVFPFVTPKVPQLLPVLREVRSATISAQPLNIVPEDYLDLARATAALWVPWGMTLAQVERAVIAQTLQCVKGNKTAAADALGIYRPTLDGKIRKYCLTDYMPEERRLRAV
jgi:two-component system, NtrC family, response regulator HydG